MDPDPYISSDMDPDPKCPKVRCSGADIHLFYKVFYRDRRHSIFTALPELNQDFSYNLRASPVDPNPYLSPELDPDYNVHNTRRKCT